MSSQVSIKQLPEITEINNDNLILVQTENSTNSLKFSNFVVGLDNTTFGSTINNNSTNIENLSTEFKGMSSTIQTLTGGASLSSVETLSARFAGGKDRNILTPTFGGNGLSGFQVGVAYANACGVFSNAKYTNFVSELDNCNTFDGSEGTFTICHGAYYDVSVVVHAESTGATLGIATYLTCNGQPIGQGIDNANDAGDDIHSVINIVREFVEGDTIGLSGTTTDSRIVGTAAASNASSRFKINSLYHG